MVVATHRERTPPPQGKQRGPHCLVDFAPHGLEFLREKQAHRRLGFSRDEINEVFADIGLEIVGGRDLAAARPDAAKLTVSLWIARDPRVITDLVSSTMELA